MLFTNMTEAFYLVDVVYDKDDKPCDYRFLEVNPAYERMMGINSEQMLGRSLFEVFPNANPITIQKYNEIAISGKSANFEVFSQAVSNKYLDVYVFSPEKGKIAVIFRDITNRKHMEADLQKSEEQYRALFNSMDEGFCIIEMLFDENEKPIDYIFIEANPHSKIRPDSTT
jgi:PAS domain S-box-containing protein